MFNTGNIYYSTHRRFLRYNSEISNIHEIDLKKRIEELELENRFLRAENTRLREVLNLPLWEDAYKGVLNII
jgi:regulator of replication initiation timing